ncbi:hypothetical protein L207DRAFT_528778 [Hyaloscypha variabilis F]|uniref:Uncharacterized protein n=1 Tax=Hyaloscypha variabilis (strain UAMH 11265 / GT02V1 / F) TaxID=1149755 RepID=A0A2J6RPJ3_HYAVF|nr:hypothetical protein L207DRAFT_528778 [Hyaloscypha variabilis F]
MRGALHSARIDGHTIRLPFPSWSWASWASAVYHYASTCEYQIKSLVEWRPAHRCAIVATDTLTHFRDLSSSNAASEQDHELLAPRELSITERELGFLRFNTESVKLDIKVKELSIRETSQICEDKTSLAVFVYYLIIGVVGNSIGAIGVPNSWLRGHETRHCEFILLSTCVENTASETCQRSFKDNPGFPDKPRSVGIQHIDGCEHQTHYHIMLID